MDELKPCPFCQRAPKVMDRACSPDVGHDWIWFASCCCGSYSANAHQHGYSEDELAKRWNTRSVEDALRARIAELEAALAAAQEDTARLDAHENLGPWAPMFDDSAGCQEKWLWYDKAGYPRRSATFRDAIDAARKDPK